MACILCDATPERFSGFLETGQRQFLKATIAPMKVIWTGFCVQGIDGDGLPICRFTFE
jgi:hypothetical protein